MSYALKLQDLDWRSFELLMTEIFCRLGYIAETTPPTNDEARDIDVHDPITNEYFRVECKRHDKDNGHLHWSHISKYVNKYDEDSVPIYIVTTNRFGKHLARKIGEREIYLWPVETVHKNIKKVNSEYLIDLYLNNIGEMNDIDSIRQRLISQHIEVRDDFIERYILNKELIYHRLEVIELVNRNITPVKSIHKINSIKSFYQLYNSFSCVYGKGKSANLFQANFDDYCELGF
jgi:hypothetical protein